MKVAALEGLTEGLGTPEGEAIRRNGQHLKTVKKQAWGRADEARRKRSCEGEVPPSCLYNYWYWLTLAGTLFLADFLPEPIKMQRKQTEIRDISSYFYFYLIKKKKGI